MQQKPCFAAFPVFEYGPKPDAIITQSPVHRILTSHFLEYFVDGSLIAEGIPIDQFAIDIAPISLWHRRFPFVCSCVMTCPY